MSVTTESNPLSWTFDRFNGALLCSHMLIIQSGRVKVLCERQAFLEAPAEASIQQEAHFFTQQKHIHLSCKKKVLPLVPAGSLDTATRRKTNNFIDLTLYETDESFLSVYLQTTEDKLEGGDKRVEEKTVVVIVVKGMR